MPTVLYPVFLYPLIVPVLVIYNGAELNGMNMYIQYYPIVYLTLIDTEVR